MGYRRGGQVAFLLASAAVLLCGRAFGHGKATARRWPSRSPRSSVSTATRGAPHGRKSPFSVVLSARDTAAVETPSSSRRTPVAGLVDGTAGASSPPLRSSLAMLPMFVVDLGLRELFHRRGWSFPSSVAGLMALFAGLVGLDRVAPPYAERAVRLLEPGSTQFMAWLPLIFVPAVLSWVRLPVVGLLGSTSSLPDAVVAAAKLEGALRHFSRSPSVARVEGRGAQFRLAVNVTKLLLTATGGWALNLGSAAAIFTALSRSPPSPTSSAALPATAAAGAAAAVSLPLKTSAADTSTFLRFFSPGLVRRLGTGMLVSGALIPVSLAVLEHPGLVPSFLGPVFEALGYPLLLLLHTLDMGAWCFLLMMLGLILTPVVAMGLATLFGFAAGRLVVSPGGALARSHPSMAVLLPLVTSVAAPIVGGCTVSFAAGHASDLRGIPFLVTEILGHRDLTFDLLSPAVLSFAAPLFRMRGMIFSNARQVIGGSIVCASTALFGVALGSRLLGIPKAFNMALQAKKKQAEAKTSLVFKLGKALRFLSPLRRHKVQPRILTVEAALGAYASPAIAGVLVLTGVLGATFGARVLDVLGLKDGVVRALVQGGPLSVLGTAAISEQELHRNGCVVETATEASVIRDASTASMILTGVAGAVLISIPPVRSALLSLALGTGTVGAAVP